MPYVWEVVGGADKGGILVRQGCELTSPKESARLCTGATVEELELKGERLHFRKISGDGPLEGWISVSINGKPLAKRTGKEGGNSNSTPSDADHTKASKETWNPYEILGLPHTATDSDIKSAFRKKSLKVHPDHNSDPDAPAQFRTLTDARNFLLHPVKRLFYNISHGLRHVPVTVQWWSDWDTIISELSCPTEDGALPAEPSPEITSKTARVDVLLFGATGFTGTLACSQILRQLPKRTWAIAGRDPRKLRLVEEKFGGGALFRGAMSVGSPEDIYDIAKSTRVLVDLSGPKWQVGSIVAQACIDNGTHYIDITGYPADALAAKTVRDELDAAAKVSGVGLVYCCGTTASMMDFGTWLLVNHFRDVHGLPTRRVDGYEFLQGYSISGTTLLSCVGPPKYEEEIKKYEPFLFGGARKGGIRKEDGDQTGPIEDEVSGMYIALTEVTELAAIRLSCALFDGIHPYGDNFLFKSWILFGNDKQAATFRDLRMSNKMLRRTYNKSVEKKKIPAPGEGAGERFRKECVCTRVLAGVADEPVSDRRKAHCVLTAGPGGLGDHYEGTATVALEAAGCVLDALDAGGHSLRHGFGTPTYHLAHLGFVERLSANGLGIKIVEGPPPRELFQNVMASAMPIQT